MTQNKNQKVYPDAQSTLEGVKDGMTLLFGGFGLCGIPEHSIQALCQLGIKEITCVSNNAGVDNFGLGLLLQTRQIKKMIASYVGENALFEKQYLDGILEVELTPQGTLAEKLRAGGAGIPAFFTPTGVGTLIAKNKESRIFHGKESILEESIIGDFAFVKAWKGDRFGNLVYRKTARNFNPLIATAGRITVAEVEELVEVGELDPDQIHTPGIFVQRIFRGTHFEKRMEHRTVRLERNESNAIPR